MSKKVLVIGGAGFIGAATCKQLTDAGHVVRVMDPKGWLPKPAGSINSNSMLMRTELHWAEIVVNLAAHMGFHSEFSRYWGHTTQGSAMLFQVIQREGIELERIVLGSSQAVYGKQQVPYEPATYTGADQPYPQSAYGLSKLHQEQIHEFFCKQMNIPLSVLRYSIVVGPGQSVRDPYVGLIRSVAMACLHEDRPVIFEDGKQLRDFVHVGDVARANCMAAEGKLDGIHNVCNPEVSTVKQIVDEIGLQVALHNEMDPAEPVLPGLSRLGDTRHVYSEPSEDFLAMSSVHTAIHEFVKHLVNSDWQSLPYKKPEEALEELKAKGELQEWNG